MLHLKKKVASHANDSKPLYPLFKKVHFIINKHCFGKRTTHSLPACFVQRRVVNVWWIGVSWWP